MEEAKAEGEAFGLLGILDECTEEGVHRLGDCEGITLFCIPGATGFLWACLETATFEPAFCEVEVSSTSVV